MIHALELIAETAAGVALGGLAVVAATAALADHYKGKLMAKGRAKR